MVHGNSISIYYGIAINSEKYDKIKKLVSLEYKDLFKEILNGRDIKYIISGRMKCMINDRTDYDDYDHIEKNTKNYVENFLVRNISSFIKINDKNDLSEYCSIEKLSIEMENSYNEIKELLELIKEYVEIVPNLFMYKYSY